MTSNYETAVFGGGCFWCTEAVFKMLKGIRTVTPGYAGGTTASPNYEEVSQGITGYAEVSRVEFDPGVITYKDLLTVFFASHDPTTLNRQGADVGSQYRSVILFTTKEQKAAAEEMIREIESAHTEGGHVVTEVVPLTVFYPAESEHRDYYTLHPERAYCQLVINPKLEKVQKKFAELLKQKSIA